MPKKQTIKGLILDANTKKGISNLTIEAWEQDVKVHDLVGKEVTDASGRFAFSFDESHWKDNAKDQHPIVFFRVYDAAGNLLRDTQHQIYWTEEQKENPIAIAIGEASKLVYGSVLLETEKPASHLVVRVYQKSLKLDRIIAASTADNNGDYSISYPAEGVDNIIVRVFNPKGKTPIASSSIVFNAREKEEVNLTVTAEVYQSLSLYETIEQSIAAVLGGLEVNTLDANQIKLLANESGIEQKELLVYQNAQVLSKDHHLSAEVFFVILHNGMETSEEKLFSLSEEQLKHLLAKSWDEHLISTARSAEILKEISVHEKLSIHYQLLYTSFSSKTTLLETWSSLKLNKTQLAVIGSAMKTVGGNSIDFWNTIKKDKTLKPLIPKLELLTGLNNVTLGNLTLIKKISQNKAVHSLADLAGWPHDKWVQTIGTATIPEEISGKPNQRIHTYATSMKRMVDYLYPTRNVIVSYASDKANQPILKADYRRFYQNNPDFLIENHNLENYLKKHPKALTGLRDKEAFTKDMGITTRLFRLSPAIDRYENMMLLKKLNITNSKGITQKGYSQFQSEYTALGGQSDSAQLIYRNAQHYSAMVNTLTMSFIFDQNIPAYVYNNNNIKQDATWRTLFGSEDYCGCQHCKSVYSPAAYLTDSLHFLENRKQTNDVSFYQVLDARRPDIKHILLNCENANTPMPYVDLVNEVLEAAVVQENMSEFDFSGHQTTRTMEELIASPQHLEEAAYASLKDAIYPWFMPFDLYNRLGKTYLEHLGVKHHKLVSMFPFSEDTLPARPSTDELNTFRKKRNIKARLALNETDWEIILGVNYMNQEAALWGANTRISSLVSVTLEKTQLSLEDLKILVNTKFVNPNGKLIINFPDLCSVEGATLKNYNGSIRKRMLQMVRLQRKLNTDIRTVDHILNALQAPEINVNVLSGIAQLVLWQEMYNLPLTELVSWVGNLPTANINDRENHRELYEQTFLSYLEGHSDTTRDLFTLSEDRKKLRNETYTFNGVSGTAIRNYISGALNISSADLNAIISVLPTKKLTLANLSIIYGTLSLARALRISISETIGLHKITTSTTEERIDQFLAVSDAFTQLQKSKFTVTQVLYLFGESQDGKIAGTRKIEILQEIREGLWKLDNQGMEENGSAPLTPEAFVFEKLGSAFGIDRNVISLLLALPENSHSYLVHIEQNIPKSYLNFFINSDDFLSQDIAPVLEEGMFLQLEELCELLNKISLLYGKLEFNTEHYQLLLTETGKSEWIDFNNLGNASALSTSFFELLKLNEIIQETSNSQINLFALMSLPLNSSEWLTNAADLLNYQDTGSFSDLIHVLGINNEETQEASVYLRLLNTIALEKHLGIHIADYTNANSQFQWAKSELDQSRVMEIIQVAKSKYGEDKWQNVTKQLRDSIREEQRDALMTFLMATKKDSFGNPLDTPEKLYAHFLLDTEMSACTVTSRIRLALSSVQLFVQRCLMNLESHASLQGIDDDEREEWKEWTWRKNYRVWEANRKVFLYPENWLEPEWRDDKTPFFKELESELQQNELTTENAESAYLNYLYKLESVSNLEILAMCSDHYGESIFNNGYYIFGRTHGNPKTLYFRKFDQNPQSFTPWEKIEVDFEGNHLVPHVHDGRLFLFWTVFLDASKDIDRNTNDVYGQPVNYKKIQLVWSEFKNGSWTCKKNSDSLIDNINFYANVHGDEGYTFALKKSRADTKLDITLWRNYSFDPGAPSSQYGYYPIIGNFEFNFDTHFVKSSINSNMRDELELGNQSDLSFGLKNQQLVRFINMGSSQKIRIGSLEGKSNTPGKLLLTTTYSLYQEGLFRANIYNRPFLLCDENNSYVVYQKDKKYNFLSFNHPMVSFLIQAINGNRSSQVFNSEFFKLQEVNKDEFSLHYSFYDPNKIGRTPRVRLDFKLDDANSQYNWELFFHIPMHIANKLRQDQKFEEAQKWFHYVFNPTSTEAIDAPKKFWVFQPFRDYVCSSEDGTPCNIQELMRMLNEESETLGFQEFEQTVHAWERNPFSPHTVARTRIIAYMKWVVMRYIDNLIEWADQLFRRDSIESLNEATQLYMLACNILGDEPYSLNEKKREDQSYNQLREKLDEFSNALVKLEDRISQQQTRSNRLSHISDISIISPQITIDDYKILKPKVPRVINQGQDEILPSNTLYFCIPQNEKLLGYWDLVQDRFFKLRHCLNIEGVYRQLPLYEPPIDPALLIKAKNSGLSIADALSAEYAPKSHYRFLVLLQKAIDYANDVRSFGASLLSALEKRDAEQMVALRSIHEVQLLNEVTLVRKEQINELKLSNVALDFSMENIENRRAYYADKEFMSPLEISEISLSAAAQTLKTISTFLYAGAGAAAVTPDYTVGVSGWGGHMVATTGGSYLARGTDYAAKSLTASASVLDLGAYLTGQFGRYERRSEDWKFQESTAVIEIKQLEKQILAAQIRMSIAKQELKNHELQVENSTKQLELVQAKFTNFELYDWMVGQLKTLYFQSYQMAFDMAKKAERALAFEHGIGADSSEAFIKFGYWDNLKEGLLSGEKLHHDLKRMEMIYMQRNKRLHEVSKTVSLAMIDAEELTRLRATGTCRISIPELLLDLDFPQHTNRKIKSVSITIPAVTGPYTGINAVLSNIYGSIACSGSQNDAGMFQFNFNDERYLPFEGQRFEPTETSELPRVNFNLEMNSEFRAFDYNTITDVLMHLHYTAEEITGGEVLTAKKNDIKTKLSDIPFTKLISIKNEFSQEWFEAKSQNATEISIDLSKISLPYVAKNNAKNITTKYALVELDGKIKLRDDGDIDLTDFTTEVIVEMASQLSDIIVVMTYEL